MIIIKNATLLNMLTDKQVCDIKIEKGIIKDIGVFDVSEFKNFKIIDAEYNLVTPGIIESHCHIGLHEEGVGEIGNDTNEKTNPVKPELRGIDSIKSQDIAFEEALDAGITTVITGPGAANIIGGTFCVLKTFGNNTLDMCMIDEVAIKMALGENPKNTYGNQKKSPATRMANVAILRENLFKAKIYYDKKQRYNFAVSQGDNSIKEPDFNMAMESLSRVFNNFPVKIHAHKQDDIITALKIIEEFKLNATIEHCTEGHFIADILAKKNQRCIIGPNMTRKSKNETKNRTFNIGKILYDAGVEFSIMTDHPVVPIQHALTQAGIFIAHGMKSEDVLRCLTINAAKSVGIDNRIGSIEPGKDADIVIWSGDPFHYMTKTLTILIEGKIVKLNGEIIAEKRRGAYEFN